MTFTDTEKIRCDVLVIGGGGAGLRAAIAAASAGANVLLVAKARVAHTTNTYLSKAIIASSGWGDSKDNSSIHVLDTMRGGCGLNDSRMVAQFSESISSEMALLQEWGVRLALGDDGTPLVIKIPGHSFPRHLVGEHWRGSDLALPLQRKAAAGGVRFLERTAVAALLQSDDRVCGAACVSADGRFTAVVAGSVVLATGGFGHLYRNTNNAPGITGDGHALAARLGAPLQDMEFVQYYPTCLGQRGSRLLLYEKILPQEGVVLRNSAGEDILSKSGCDVPADIGRDQLSRLIMKEILEDPHQTGSVEMDLRALSREAIEGLSAVLPAASPEGGRVFHVTPTTHFCMGGIKVDPRGGASLPGLFAVGEVTAGAHGANRLGGNALAEIIAMGSLVGTAAATSAKGRSEPVRFDAWAGEEKRRLEALFSPKGVDPSGRARELKDIMWRHAGIVRDRPSLEFALNRLAEWKDEPLAVQTPRDLMRSLEFTNMRLVGEMVCRSALERTESRGSHFRSDFPRQNDADWLLNIQVRSTPSGLLLDRIPVQTDGRFQRV